MKTGKKMLVVMLAAALMMVAGGGLAHAADELAKQIRADLKSGMPLEEVMAKARKDGKSIREAVDAAIMAGAKPSDVVYVAIRNNDSDVAAIVAAAIETGANLDDVVISAKSAGASKQDVNAGVKKTTQDTDKQYLMLQVVASIYANDTLSYSPPGENKGASDANRYGGPAFPYRVPTTGGATPSTKTASPI